MSAITMLDPRFPRSFTRLNPAPSVDARGVPLYDQSTLTRWCAPREVLQEPQTLTGAAEIRGWDVSSTYPVPSAGTTPTRAIGAAKPTIPLANLIAVLCVVSESRVELPAMGAGRDAQ